MYVKVDKYLMPRCMCYQEMECKSCPYYMDDCDGEESNLEKYGYGDEGSKEDV